MDDGLFSSKPLSDSTGSSGMAFDDISTREGGVAEVSAILFEICHFSFTVRVLL